MSHRDEGSGIAGILGYPPRADATQPERRGKGRGMFTPSAYGGDGLAVETVRAVQSSAGAFTPKTDARLDRSRRKVSDWDVSGVKGRPLPPSAAGDIYRSPSPLKHEDFSAPVKPKHPIAVAQEESARHAVEILDAFGQPVALPRRSLSTITAAQKKHAQTDRQNDSDDEKEPGSDGAEDHRVFAASLRSSSGVQTPSSHLTFHDGLYATEDKRSQNMAAVNQMAAARLDRHWEDGMSDISDSLGELESLFEIGETAGDPAATIAQAKAEALQAEAELVASWQKRPSPLSARHQRHDAAGAPAVLRQQTPRPRLQHRLLTNTPAAAAPPEQLASYDLEQMRADVAQLAMAAARANENAKRSLAQSSRRSTAARNEAAGNKLQSHNWSFAEIGGGDTRGRSDARCRAAWHTPVTPRDSDVHMLRRALSSQQAMLRWAEKPGLIEKHRGLPSDELVRSRASLRECILRTAIVAVWRVCVRACMPLSDANETWLPADFSSAFAQEKRKRAWLQGTLLIRHEGNEDSADRWTTHKAAHSALVEAHHITRCAGERHHDNYLRAAAAAASLPTADSHLTLCLSVCRVGLRLL